MRFADAINVGSSVIVAGVCVALGYSYFHRLNQPQTPAAVLPVAVALRAELDRMLGD